MQPETTIQPVSRLALEVTETSPVSDGSQSTQGKVLLTPTQNPPGRGLEGQMVVRCGDDELVVGAGHWVSMPRGVPHTFVVVGDRDARILLVHDNSSFRDLVRAIGVPATARVVPEQPVFPTMDELARVARLNDLTPVGPPDASGRSPDAGRPARVGSGGFTASNG
jgi:hypothetical protein